MLLFIAIYCTNNLFAGNTLRPSGIGWQAVGLLAVLNLAQTPIGFVSSRRVPASVWLRFYPNPHRLRFVATKKETEHASRLKRSGREPERGPALVPS